MSFKYSFVGLLIFVACGLSGLRLTAQTAPATSAATPPASESTSRIRAASEPYSFEWNGTTGSLKRDALASEPEQNLTLAYLHSDPGPKGYSKYLAWFLARDNNNFSLVWAYLNDSGSEFYCWLYRYPSNQLTSLRFVGDYRFAPAPEPVAATPAVLLNTAARPRYSGPDFRFGDWNSRGGTLPTLDLLPTKAETFADSSVVSGPTSLIAPAPAAPVKTLAKLQIAPLHEIHVANGNGWRTQGWRELHALAYDANKDPYYLIAYSNVTKGYAIDLTRAQTYVTDFGQPVRFGNDSSVFGSKDDQLVGPPSLLVRRFSRYEITLASSQKYTNPYAEVLLDADLTAPDGKRLRVAGYWDGATTWRVRLAPMQVGNWTWRTHSNDPDLNNQFGTFTCVNTDETGHGFVEVRAGAGRKQQFQYADGTPFFPSFLRDPLHFIPNEGVRADVASVASSGLRLASLPATGNENLPASFRAFQQRMDQAALMGFNRLADVYLLDKVQFAAHTQQNEGGAPFTNYDLSRLNPAYFQWMDRRLTYANDKGLIPDLGLSSLNATVLAGLDDADLRRLWRYVVARYASYNVCWNLFAANSADSSQEARIIELAQATRRSDPYQHPISTMSRYAAGSNPVAVPTAPPKSNGNGSMLDGDSYVVTPDPGTRPQQTAALASDFDAPAPLLPFADTDWLDVFTVTSLPNNLLPGLSRLSHPAVVTDARPATITDLVRYRLWATRMRGQFWDGAASLQADGQEAFDSPDVQWASYCAKFFAGTRFWRLLPHPEMQGGPEEDPFARRRRHRAEVEAAQSNKTANPEVGSESVSSSPSGPIYILADPSWEYVVYFQQGGRVTLDLIEATGQIQMTWFNPRTGESVRQEELQGGAYRTFTPPDTNDWVLYLTRR